MKKLGEYSYDGNGELLDRGVNYTLFDTGSTIEAYPEGEGEPIVMNKGAFTSLKRGKLRKNKGNTPMK